MTPMADEQRGKNDNVNIELEKMESKAVEDMYGIDIDSNVTPRNKIDARATETGGDSAYLDPDYLDPELEKMRSKIAEEMYIKSESELHTIQALDINNYVEWDYDDITNWIMSLENGVFSHYEDILRKALKLENVTGDVLNDEINSNGNVYVDDGNENATLERKSSIEALEHYRKVTSMRSVIVKDLDPEIEEKEDDIIEEQQEQDIEIRYDEEIDDNDNVNQSADPDPRFSTRL